MLKSTVKRIIKSNTPRWIVLLIDLYIVCNTFIIAYLVRFNFNFDFDSSKLSVQLPIILVFSLISFLVVGSYKGIVRHTGFRDSLNIVFAAILLFSFLSGFVLLNREFKLIPFFTFPISILVIHFLLNTFFLVASRFVFKELFKLIFSDLHVDRRILIYGAGETGLLTYSVLRDIKENKVQIVGFIDDDKRKWGKRINGLKVYKYSNITPEFIKRKGISEIIIAFQDSSTSKLIAISDKLSLLPVNVKIVPHATSWIEGDLNPKQIKNVRIEDLLGRKPINLNNPIVENELKNKVILITGAAGSIGCEIARQVAICNYKKLILVDQSESPLYEIEQEFVQKEYQNFNAIVADVRSESRMKNVFEAYKPNIVFHAAAYKHVPLMENNPYEAVNVNVLGTKTIAELAIKHKTEKFVMISTDKAVNPTNVMGATKRLAEMMVSCLKEKGETKFITTRFGNVLGSNGSVIPLFKKQIEKGGPLTVTHHEITRYFMTIPEACQLVLEAGVMGEGGEIFVFDMGESVKIYDLAKNMIHLSGLNHPDDIKIDITGLRPGEKIYEELLGDGEKTKKTHHPKIMIAKVKPLNCDFIEDSLHDLCTHLRKSTNYEIVKKIKQIVPEFISNNSEFEKIDHE
ncbi:nucleoside-diphosphate sugar epimerase/dehydratase [Lutibacter sp. TH_r2]|uniref:nucleoside-diphosphate sugar epimerase/dehydratase n=1 Tax=Lutibacter sp. TH_r2 TaxID=3082083 RepID=UPI002953CEC0|nr:nucleoside-diphosphate sugar epimerase/dehydratase [Lutibacter sp. TH_r2]MDV7187782.1 nucleoside-diphosphate sugar epimerase/dehydratase [Lutibacter sp. TH_r2]